MSNETEDFWNTSKTTPSTLDSFFDEESDVNWTGVSKNDPSYVILDKDDLDDQSSAVASLQKSNEENKRKGHKQSRSSGNLSSILDNISIHSDSAIIGLRDAPSPFGKQSVVGKALGEKIENWKNPSVALKWTREDNNENICKKCVSRKEKIIELSTRLEKSYSRHNVTLLPEDTIKKVILGKPYSFEGYKTLADKISLLDSAADSMDSSALLAVLVFLKSTIKSSLFNKELQKRPHIAPIYVNYLKSRAQYTDALDTLFLLGETEEAALYKYHLAIKSNTGDVQVKSLGRCLESHLKDPKLSFEAKQVEQHRALLAHQIPIDDADAGNTTGSLFIEYPRTSLLTGQSLLSTLSYCSVYHFNLAESDAKSPLALRKQFKISDRQFLWSVLTARGRVKHWPMPSDLEHLVIQRNLLTTLGNLSGLSSSGRVLKNSLPIGRVIERLAEDGAPSSVIGAYINLLDSNDSKLKSALAYACHHAVIEVYVAQKDRSSLENYLKQIPFGSPDYVKAEHALKNGKWKN